MEELGKYPIMLVKGESVTFAQADEILIRTNNWEMDSPDHEWTDDVYRTAGIRMNDINTPSMESLAKFKKRYGVLDLEYCINQRIMTRHILGPRGWCDWDGTISYELPIAGKWPTFSELEAEWKLIASTFPFLRVKVQFAEQKIDNTLGWGDIDRSIKPTFQIKVDDGDAVADVNPDGFKRITFKYSSKNDVRTMVRRAGSVLGQKGVPLARLREALDNVQPL